MEILLHQPRQRRSHRHMEILWDCDLSAMLQVSYTYRSEKKWNHLNIFSFTRTCLYVCHHHDFMLCLGCFMISWILMTDFSCFILMISVHLFLMFIYFVYFHMCVCLHAETASSRGLLEVTGRYSHLCVDNLLFHHNCKKILWLEPEYKI